MIKFFLLGLSINLIHCSYINPYPRFKLFIDDGDVGEPLFLTPLIEQNRISEAKQLSKVQHPQLSFVNSHTGYLTVNKTYNSNLFFWFIEAHNDWQNSPLILWLQGGPGASSLFGLFTENGPFQFNDAGTLKSRKYSWHLHANLIYIDNPAGTGFSFTDNDAGYARNEDDVGINLQNALSQFYKVFPELRKNEFFITGESYGGKYVPAVGYYVHKMNEQATENDKINLKGLAIGNGLSDPVHQLDYGNYLFQHGFIDLNGLNSFEAYQNLGIRYIENEEYEKAFDIFDLLIDGDETGYPSLFTNLTGLTSYFNYVKDGDDKSDQYLGDFLQSSSVRKAIHVGNNTFHDVFNGENRVELFLRSDVMASVAKWVSELLSHYRVIIYNGQLDIIVAYPLTANYLQNLKFNGDREYKTAQRHIYKVQDEIAGYVKSAGNLTELLVRNAGHMVPSDQPKWAFDIIGKLVNHQNFIQKPKTLKHSKNKF